MPMNFHERSQEMLHACRYQATLVRRTICRVKFQAESSDISAGIINIHNMIVCSEKPAWHEPIGWSGTLRV